MRKGNIDWGKPEWGSFESRLVEAAGVARLSRDEVKLHFSRPRLEGFANKRPWWMEETFQKELSAVLDFSLQTHLTRLDAPASAVHDPLLRESDPELAKLLGDVPSHKFIVPDAWRAVREKPAETRLHVAALALASRGQRVSASALARELKISRATLYRLHSGREIKRAIYLTRKTALAAEAEDYGPRKPKPR